MYCTQCGTLNDESATHCSRCGAALYRPGSSALPRPQSAHFPNYLVQAILVTICCCQIPGIVAIVYAAQVNGFLLAGDFRAARRASRLAYVWSWVAFALGMSFVVVYGAVVALGIAMDR